MCVAASDSLGNLFCQFLFDQYFNTQKMEKTKSLFEVSDLDDKKKKKKRNKNSDEAFNIPGVHKIVLPDEIQDFLKCVVGDQVSIEKPWTYVEKSACLEHLDFFASLQNELANYPCEKLFLGYIPDETNDYDEFYICLTEESEKQVSTIVKALQDDQEKRLKEKINKKCGNWAGLGSEDIVSGNINKNNRPLLQVEIETKYPLPRNKTQFRLQNAEDRYRELLCDDPIDIINKKKVDNCAQSSPNVASNYAQTICTYPKNNTFQYKYEYTQITDIEEFEKKLHAYAEVNFPLLEDFLNVNGAMNLYSHDYDNLELRGRKINHRGRLKVKEYLTYFDVDRCKGKMVEHATWHPLISGLIAVSYSSNFNSFYKTEENCEDEIFKAVHDANPVLIWGFDDYLKPKLALEAHREISKLSFCPYDGNILIGGCKNGQVLIWDITDKIQQQEHNEDLTESQKCIHNYIYRLLGWNRYSDTIPTLKPTIVSELNHSHKSSVVGIHWRSPYHDFQKNGTLLKTEGKISLQFETCSEDGTIFIWDLSQKPSFRRTIRMKQFKRLKRLPSSLLLESKFSGLELKPTYIVLVNREKKSLPVTHTTIPKYPKLNYEQINFVNEETDIAERIVYKPIMEIVEEIDADFHIGTLEGEYSHIKWSGQEFDLEEETLITENCEFLLSGTYHDGPITQTTINTNNVTLTVGGKIFALWRDDYKHGPILWRKLNDFVCQGRWHGKDQSRCNLVKNDGTMEQWVLHIDSCKKIDWSVLTKGSVSVWKEHPRKIEKTVIGVGDERGTFRLHVMNDISKNDVEEISFNEFIEKEIEVKTNFYKWQEEWRKKYVKEEIEETKKDAKKTSAVKKSSARDDDKKKIVKLTEIEKSRKKWIQDDKNRGKATILARKRADMEDLERLKEPLEKSGKDDEAKKQKQKAILKQAEKIFSESVATILPIDTERSNKNKNPYETVFSAEEKLQCIDDFNEISKKASEFLEKNSYEYEFKWEKLLRRGLQRKKILLDLDNRYVHKQRFVEEKLKKAEEKRLRELEQARIAEEKAKQKSKPKRHHMRKQATQKKLPVKTEKESGEIAENIVKEETKISEQEEIDKKAE